MDDEEQRFREIARRPSPLKGLLDIGSTIGTYGVEKAREMPDRAVQDIKNAVVAPAESAYHAGRQIVGEEPYDRDEAIKHALNIANAMTLGAGAYEAPAGAVRSGLSRDFPLMAVHETDLGKLRLSQRQGGLPARSTAIINPKNPLGMFGDVSLVGGKEWATPSGGHHRVFQGDPYTPNPAVENRPVEDVVTSVREQPYRLTAQSVVAPEAVRAYLTPEFGSFGEMEGKSKLLTSREKSQEYKNLSNEFIDDIRERMLPYYKDHVLLPDVAAHRAMVDPEYRAKYFKNLPEDVEADIAALPEISAQAPQHYFEAKNYGIANVGHPSMAYKGAIVPHRLAPAVDPILREFNISNIIHTDTDDPERLVRAYEHFKPLHFAEGGAAWTRKEGKNPEGGLNAKGRASYNRQNPGKPGLKPPAPHPKTERDASRRASFCARMKGMKAKLTSSETANDPDSRINKSLRAWNCRADGGPIMHPDIIDALRLAERRNFDDGGSAYDGNPFSRSSRGGLFSKMTPQSSFASAAPSTTPAQSQMNPFLRQAASPLMSLPAPPMPVLRQDYTAPTPQIAPPMPVLRQSPQAPTPQIAPPMAAPMAAAAPNQNPVLRSDSMPAPVQNYAAPIQNYAAPVQNYAAPVENYISPETAPRQNPVLRQDYAAPAAPQQNSTSLNDAIPAPMQQNPVLRTDTPSPATANQNYDRPMISSAQGYDQPMTSASNYAQPTAQTQNSAPAVSSSPVFDKTEADRPYYTPSAQQNSAALNDVIPTPAQTYNQPLTSSPSFTQQAPQAQNFMQPQSQPAPSGYSQPQSQAATTSQQVSSNPNVTSDYQAMLARLPRALSDYIYQPTNMSQSGFGGYTPQSYNYAGNQSSFFNRNSGGYPYAQRQYQAPRQYSYPQQYQYPQTQMAQRNTMPFVGKNGGGSSWGRI